MNAVFDRSLVLHLPLGKLDGAPLRSRDAWGHSCSVTGALWTPLGRSFDGVDDRIDIANAPSLNPAAAHTICCWIKTRSFPDRITPVGKWGNAGDKAYSMTSVAVGDQRMRHYLSPDGTADVAGATMTAALVSNTWYHLAFTFDGAAQVSRAFACGDLVDSVNVGISVINAAGQSGIRVAGHNNGLFWVDGLIGEVRVYSRALTPAEIQQVYMATKWRYR